MIDPEPYVYNAVASALKEQFEGITVRSEYNPNQETTKKSFPLVTIEMIDVSDNQKSRTAKGATAVEVTFECNAYSNDVTNRKGEAKEIIYFANDEFEKLGFKMRSCSPTPNLRDSTIFRMTAIYWAIVDGDFFTYTS
jgi:hypothetical protein